MIGDEGMYICLDCQRLFGQPKEWEETHNLDTPPYEHWSGCPYCQSDYAEAYRCDNCGRWIESDYIKINDNRYCECCFDKYELGEE